MLEQGREQMVHPPARRTVPRDEDGRLELLDALEGAHVIAHVPIGWIHHDRSQRRDEIPRAERARALFEEREVGPRMAGRMEGKHPSWMRSCELDHVALLELTIERHPVRDQGVPPDRRVVASTHGIGPRDMILV